VYYRIEQGGQEIIPQTFFEHDDGEDYHFSLAFANEGKLACVYEVSRYRKTCYYVLMYDAESGESWPRVREDETRTDVSVRQKWRSRYQRVRSENPEMGIPPGFE
jgi:hypothetical protein